MHTYYTLPVLLPMQRIAMRERVPSQGSASGRTFHAIAEKGEVFWTQEPCPQHPIIWPKNVILLT